MTAGDPAPIGMTAFWRGGHPAADLLFLRPLVFLFLFLVRSLVTQRRLIVWSVAAGLILAPLPAVFSDERLAPAGQSDISALDVSGHGHSHDGNDDDDHPAGHSHSGHDPADHSHQFAFLGVGVSHDVLPLPERWPSLRHGTPDQAVGFGIDRPPKRLMSL